MSRLRAVLLLVLLAFPLAGASGAFAARAGAADPCGMSCCRRAGHMPACATRHASCAPRPAAATLSALPPLLAPAAAVLHQPAACGVVACDYLVRAPLGSIDPPYQPPRA